MYKETDVVLARSRIHLNVEGGDLQEFIRKSVTPVTDAYKGSIRADLATEKPAITIVVDRLKADGSLTASHCTAQYLSRTEKTAIEEPAMKMMTSRNERDLIYSAIMLDISKGFQQVLAPIVVAQTPLTQAVEKSLSAIDEVGLGLGLPQSETSSPVFLAETMKEWNYWRGLLAQNEAGDDLIADRLARLADGEDLLGESVLAFVMEGAKLARDLYFESYPIAQHWIDKAN